MKGFVNMLRSFVRALPHFFLFELMFKLLLVAIGAPAVTLILRLTAKAAGVGYVSDESLYVYLTHPVTVVTVVFMLFFVGMFSFIELTALTACFACSSKGEKITVGGMFLTGARSFSRVFKGTGMLYFLVFMFFMPLAQFSITSGVFLAPIMPVLRRIFASVSGAAAIAAYVLLELLFTMFFARRCYALHYLVLTGDSFPQCIRRSKQKLHRKRLKMAVSLALYSLLVFTVIAAAVLILSFIIVLFIRGFSRPDKALRSALRVVMYTWRVIYAMSSFFAAPSIFCWLTERFNTDTAGEKDLTIPDRDRKKMSRRRSAVVVACLTAAGLGVNVLYLSALHKGNVRFSTGIFQHTQISAHRGFSAAAPENTYYSFEAALDSGADYIELDVQMTRDGKLVVFHDEKLDRTTNGTGKLSDHTYAELMELSAGSWFGRNGEFADARIMLLSEVFEQFGGKTLFNVEIKDHGDTAAAVEETVRLIEEYGLVTSCYVTSFSYRLVREVKQLDPRIKTAMTANFSTATAYSQLKYIDAVSMNYTFVNQSVVNTAHMNGKKIFVWTVDRTDDMKQMLALGVDNIITNRPDKAAELVYSSSTGDLILTALDAIFGNS
ncbi:MAG: glycerophosphoryl diester phosphodiesterase membrane domain-containing protein [Ruminococcus sp.]|nr:glycerophosphoryl diester phosphodiesterase membrane domain-containing protein [Ruminococcus sp.]